MIIVTVKMRTEPMHLRAIAFKRVGAKARRRRMRL